ncbi:MAG: divalent-cation tolerance protein CutA [Candidatus Buchananbacteria bacterium CG10_big_fil_rev_8_21_14_0_10_42_9]|uniref:Divalent-cation tolerance protein CutA n=1 Tax=Candidatus Buchananbacteria bacterium CG10_big_fil_rev_8_21_14_0_10_42_9 TaxID=1974526 RepID=A0A2H0W2D8_9BACT|nr:MAG: divalent-cation tolerance protein CutA [Candidatus Buchananbacteria bacterium CG10_big_fil_rev_8_21_14_0_10_42_9]
MILIYTTHKNLVQARKIGKILLTKKLVACANYFPISSSYRWKDKIINEREVVGLFKTANENWGRVKLIIEKLHPDEVPCIERLAADANPKFLQWINNVTKITD